MFFYSSGSGIETLVYGFLHHILQHVLSYSFDTPG